MHQFKTETQTLFYEEKGTLGADVQLIWGHGWGQSHHSLLPLAESLPLYHHYVVDFPGFGASPRPAENWSTADYAAYMAVFIDHLPPAKLRLWVGHSFGCRVGVQLGAKYPTLLQGLVLVAGAGLRRKLPLLKRVYLKTKVYSYKALKHLCRMGLVRRGWLEGKFGSADYRNAGDLRPIFLNVIREHLAAEAKVIKAPTLLIYGENDLETPPSMGKEYATYIQNAQYHELSGQDHYSLIGTGRHQTVFLLNQFIKNLQKEGVKNG